MSWTANRTCLRTFRMIDPMIRLACQMSKIASTDCKLSTSCRISLIVLMSMRKAPVGRWSRTKGPERLTGPLNYAPLHTRGNPWHVVPPARPPRCRGNALNRGGPTPQCRQPWDANLTLAARERRA